LGQKVAPNPTAAGHTSVAFTYDWYGHLFPEIDKQAAQKLERVRSALPEIPGVP
jgi:hypothetical protein